MGSKNPSLFYYVQMPRASQFYPTISLQPTPYGTVNLLHLYSPPSPAPDLRSLLTRHILTRTPIIIMRHLQPSPLIPTLNIEPLVRLAAIQNTLIASNLLGHEIQRLDELQTEFLALLIFRNSDILDMSYESEVVDAISNRLAPISSRRDVEF